MPVRFKDITFAVKTFNRPKTLFRCLRSLRFFSPESQIVVCDDSTIDYKYPEDLIPHIRLLRTEPNIGMSAGRNRAIAAVDTPYCFLIDDDQGLQKRSNWRGSLKTIPEPWLQGFVGWPFREEKKKLIRGGFDFIWQQRPEGKVVAIITKCKSGGACDFLMHNFLAPTELLQSFPRQEHMITREHFSWFWDLNQLENRPAIHVMPHKYAWLHFPQMEAGPEYTKFREAGDALASQALRDRGISRIFWVKKFPYVESANA